MAGSHWLFSSHILSVLKVMNLVLALQTMAPVHRFTYCALNRHRILYIRIRRFRSKHILGRHVRQLHLQAFRHGHIAW
jgi:hypothetical protein